MYKLFNAVCFILFITFVRTILKQIILQDISITRFLLVLCNYLFAIVPDFVQTIIVKLFIFDYTCSCPTMHGCISACV